MKSIICFSNKSSVTGRAIAEKLDAIRKRTNRKATCDLFIRWGSLEEFGRLRSKVELNTLTAVKNTVDKLAMLKLLSTAGIQTVKFGTDPELIVNFLDHNGKCYIRSRAGVVRYGVDYDTMRDAYYSKPVLYKRREYRVHVFNGKIIGIYEKVPLVEGAENRPKLFKQDTCKFVKCDPAICRVKIADQEMCIAAVNTLDLLFGGVDLIRDRHGNCYVCEVNSAPGLNEPMLDQYINAINTYVTNLGV